MLSDPVAEAFGLIHRHPSGENFFRVCQTRRIWLTYLLVEIPRGFGLGRNWSTAIIDNSDMLKPYMEVLILSVLHVHLEKHQTENSVIV